MHPDTVAWINRLGETVLKDAFVSASYVFLHTGQLSNWRQERNYRAGKESLVFIQGTGLDIMLCQYGLDYNPEVLRTTFYTFFHYRSTI